MKQRCAPENASSPSSGRRAWRSSCVITAGFVVAMGLLFWFGSPVWTASLHSGSYADLSQFTAVGSAISHGRLSAIYRSNVGNLALPLSFFLFAPIWPLLALLHGPVPGHDPATLVAGTFVLSFGAVLLHAVRRLACDLGITQKLWALQTVAALVVLVPTYEFGHFEDVLALAGVLYALRYFLRGRFVAAALWLSVAISFKQWAVMLLLLFVASAPKGTRVRTCVAAVALPLALGTAALALDGSSAHAAFFSPPPGNPIWGHSGVDPSWLGLSSPEGNRIAALVLAAVLGLKLRRVKDPARVLATVSVVLLVRPLSEPVNYSYYWSPAALCVILASIIALRRIRWGTAAWIVLAVMWSVPKGLESSAPGWWACQILLLSASAFCVRQDLLSGRQATEVPVTTHKGPEELEQPHAVAASAGALR